MFNKKALEVLERENERLREECKRLNNQNDELVKKVMALANKGAYLLTNQSDVPGSPLFDIQYDEWGAEIEGARI